jgi:hypothetical protein
MSVLRLIFGYIAKALLIAVPLLTPQFASLGVVQQMGVVGGDDKKAGALLSLAILALVFLYEAVERGVPRLDASRFRDDYLEQLVRKEFRLVRKHLRFNVMLARRRWYMLFIGREFHWVASRGFDLCHRDVKLWLAGWQGVCGEAFRDQEMKFVDLRGVPPLNVARWRFWQNPFWLFAWQLDRTKHVKAILSVPMILKRGSGGNPWFVKVGVINIDAVDDEGAEFLKNNWAKMRKPLLAAGALLAAIR